ncbi:uncharacterized protein LOC109017283 [Juglans regia]|uniref:Uncharacterized protein LOC109017283 n=1 Tax=Juglans regia TaxID=51240 RepID=A0A6P9F380_JUGRE|nr:uncharacterized protein LOC109017283 [Juglans regia]
MAGKYQVRSISLPSRSHPSTVRLEEELNRLKIREETSTLTSESICKGLVGLEELYRCVDDLLNMASTQQVLSQLQHEKYVEELLDGSVRLLDICGITRDAMLQIREHVQVLQSALRRRKGDSSIESSINSYTCFRKKMKKDAKKLIAALKQMESKCGASPILDLDHHLSAVIRVLREVCLMNVSTFQSLLMFLTTPVSKPISGWSLVSKLMHKSVIACEEKQEKVNEMEVVDAALSTLCRSYASSKGADPEKAQSAKKRLEDLEISIEELENSLECVFRRLIRTRASLLNIISQ